MPKNLTLEEQLTAAAADLRAQHSELHAQRNALGAELTALVNAPPNRADLQHFFERFVADLLRREPHAPLYKLRTILERFVKSPHAQEVDIFLEGLCVGARSGNSEFADALFMALLEPVLLEQAKRLANDLPWPETAGLPADERAKQAAVLKEKKAKIYEEIKTVEATAKRLHVSLEPDVEPAQTA